MVVANKVSRSRIAKKLLKREKLNFDDYIKKNKIKKKKRSKKIDKNPIRGLKKSKKQKKLILEGGVDIFNRGKSTDSGTARTSSGTGSGSGSSTDKKSGSSIYQKTGLDAVGKRLRTVFAGPLKRRLFKIILAENKIFKKGIELKKNLNKLENKITSKFGNLSGFLKADIFGDSTGNLKNLKDLRKYTSVIANIRENKYFNFTAKCSGTNLAKFRSNFKDLKNFARSIKKKFSTTVGINFKSTISDFKKYGNRHNRFLMCRIYAIRKKELEYNYQYYNLIGNIKKFLKQDKLNQFIGEKKLKIDNTIFKNTKVNNFPIFIYDNDTLTKIKKSETSLQNLISQYLDPKDKNSSQSLNDGKKINYKIKREQRNKIKKAINKIDKKDKYFALILFIIVEFYNESKLIRNGMDKLVNNYAFPSYDGLNFCLTKLRKILKYGEFYSEYINKLNNIETKVNYLCNSLSSKIEVLFSSTVLDNKENYEKLIYYKTSLNKINEIEMYLTENKSYFDQAQINNIVSNLNGIIDINDNSDYQLRKELALIQNRSNLTTSSQLSNHLFKSLSSYLTNKIKLLDGTLEKTKDEKQFSITDLSDRKQGIINLSKKNQKGGSIKTIVQTPLDTKSLSNIKINKISKEILEELYSDYMFLLNNPLYLISKDGFNNFYKRTTNELGNTTVSGLKLFTLGLGLKMEDSKKQLQKRKKTKGAIFINRMYANLLMKVLDFGVLNINLDDTDGQIPLNFPNGTALNSLPGFIRNNIFKNFDSGNDNYSDFSKISNIYQKVDTQSQVVPFSNPTAISKKFSVDYIPASMASISYLTRREIISILGLTKSTELKYELNNDMGKQIDIILKDKYNTIPMDSIRQMYLMNIIKPLQYRMMDLFKNDKKFGEGYLQATARELKDSARTNDQKYLKNVISNNVLVRLNNNLYRNDFNTIVLGKWAMQPVENKKIFYNTFKDISQIRKVEIFNGQINSEYETNSNDSFTKDLELKKQNILKNDFILVDIDLDESIYEVKAEHKKINEVQITIKNISPNPVKIGKKKIIINKIEFDSIDNEHPLKKFYTLYFSITKFMNRINNDINTKYKSDSSYYDSNFEIKDNPFKRILKHFDTQLTPGEETLYNDKLQTLAKNFNLSIKQKFIDDKIKDNIFSIIQNINIDGKNKKYYENGILALKIINSFNECDILNINNSTPPTLPTIHNNELQFIYFMYQYSKNKPPEDKIFSKDGDLYNRKFDECIKKIKEEATIDYTEKENYMNKFFQAKYIEIEDNEMVYVKKENYFNIFEKNEKLKLYDEIFNSSISYIHKNYIKEKINNALLNTNVRVNVTSNSFSISQNKNNITIQLNESESKLFKDRSNNDVFLRLSYFTNMYVTLDFTDDFNKIDITNNIIIFTLTPEGKNKLDNNVNSIQHILLNYATKYKYNNYLESLNPNIVKVDYINIIRKLRNFVKELEYLYSSIKDYLENYFKNVHDINNFKLEYEKSFTNWKSLQLKDLTPNKDNVYKTKAETENKKQGVFALIYENDKDRKTILYPVVNLWIVSQYLQYLINNLNYFSNNIKTININNIEINRLEYNITTGSSSTNFETRYNELKTKHEFKFDTIFSSLDYINGLTKNTKLKTINEYVNSELNKLSKNEPTSCIDDYYKLDYVTQYSFYLALIVLINKKDNKTGLYLFTDFEGFKNHINNNKDNSLQDLIQPKDYHFLIKNIDLRLFRRLPGELLKYILKSIDISLLMIPSWVAKIRSEQYYTFPAKQKVKDKIAKDEYRNIQLYGSYFIKRLNYLLELINPIPKQYENDFGYEAADRTNFEIMMTYLINTVQINNIDLTLPLDKNGKFVELPVNESNKMFSIQPYNIKPKFRVPSIKGGIKYFTKWMGLGGLFVIKYLSFILKIPFRSLKILIQFILAEKFIDGETYNFDPRMINFIIWGIRHKIYQQYGKIDKSPEDFFIGGLKEKENETIKNLIFNIGETGNIRQLPKGSSKLKRFFDNSEAFSSKSIIYYSVNILFDILTDKDSEILKNAATGATGAKTNPIYEVNIKKDSYPIEFAAKLLMYNLLKINEFEKEKEEKDENPENKIITDEPNLSFSSIINDPNNINETSGSIGYKNKLYEQVVETIIKLCGSSNNKEVLISISKEFFTLLDKSSDKDVQDSIIKEVETSFSLAFGTYINQFNLVGNKDKLSEDEQKLLKKLFNITDSSDLKNRFELKRFNMDFQYVNNSTRSYVSEIIEKELYKPKTDNIVKGSVEIIKGSSKQNINISNDKIEFPDSKPDVFEVSGFEFKNLKGELKILFLNHTMFRFGLIKLNATLIAFIKNASKFEHMALKQNYILGIRNIDNKGLIQKVDDTIFKNELTDVELEIQQGTFNPFLYDNCYQLNEIALPNLIQYYKLYINNILERPTNKLTNKLNTSENDPDRINEIRQNYSKTSTNYQYTITKLLMFLKCNNLYNDYLLCYKEKIKESQDKFKKKIGTINSSRPTKTDDESFNNALKNIDDINVKDIKINIEKINLLVSEPDITINQSESFKTINNILDKYQVAYNDIYIVIDERIFNPFINKLYIKKIEPPPGISNLNYSNLKYNKISKDYKKLKDLFDTFDTNINYNIKSSGGLFLKNIINTIFLQNDKQEKTYILNNINKLKNVLLRIKQILGESIKFVFNKKNEGILNELVKIIKATQKNINFNLKDKHINSNIYDLLYIFDENDTNDTSKEINISLQNKQFKKESNSIDGSNKLINNNKTCFDSTLKYLNIDDLFLNKNYELTDTSEAKKKYGHKEIYENTLFENTNLEFKFLEQLNMVLDCWAKTGFKNKLQKNITSNNNKTNFDKNLKKLIVEDCLKKQNSKIQFTTNVDWEKKNAISTEFVFTT